MAPSPSPAASAFSAFLAGVGRTRWWRHRAALWSTAYPSGADGGAASTAAKGASTGLHRPDRTCAATASGDSQRVTTVPAQVAGSPST